MTVQVSNAPVSAMPVIQKDDEIDLGYVLAVCWDHRKLIMGITALCTLLGILYAVLAVPIYRADALLQVEKQQPSAAAELQFLLGQDAATSTTQIEILKSRMILGQAADQVGLDLVVEPNYFPVLGKALARYGVTRPGFARGWTSVWAGESISVEALSVEPALFGERLTLQVGEGGSFTLADEEGKLLGEGQVGRLLSIADPSIELKVAGVSAPPGAKFELIKQSQMGAIRDIQSRFAVNERGRESGILELRLTGEAGDEIQRTLNAISQVFLVQNINRQAAEAENRLKFLEEQAPDIRETLTRSEDQLNRFRADNDSIDLNFETKSMLERLVAVESQLNEMQLREAELAERFTASHPSYRTLLEKKGQLEAEKLRLEKQVENLPETQQQVLRLNRDVEVTQQIYMQMLNTMQELRIARAGTIGNVRILDEAMVAPFPIAPKRSYIVLAAALGGLMLALVVVFLRRMTNRGIEHVDQLEEIGVPVYATIPLSDAQVKLTRKEKRTDKKQGSRVGGMLAWINPADLSIEALRGLRTSLHFAMLEASNNRLMLTGPSPAIGKSFIAANLAAVCAQAKQKVLLVDADLRKGHVHTIFSESSGGGLADYLAGKLDHDAIIRSSNDPNLDYVARGTPPPNPSELLMRDSFRTFLDSMSKRYQLIIIDTPPVMAVTDAMVVGKQVGTALMVVRYQVNPAKEVERTLQQLKSTGVNVKGAILNALERSASASYGYGYAYTDYSYRPDDS